MRTFQQPNIKQPPVAVDSVGWPKADFSTIFQSGFDKTGHVYRGTYKVSFTGQAKLGLWNTPGKIVSQAYDPGTNTTTADTFRAADLQPALRVAHLRAQKRGRRRWPRWSRPGR